MKCSICDRKAVFSDPALCKDHLIEHVESSVADTIKKYSLCTKEDRICVAASGGKDSVALLSVLSSLGFNVEALAVDEGIAGYRDESLVELKKFCSEFDIPLSIVSFEDETGKTLDLMVEGRHPCSVCGVFRRYLLNKHSKDYDLLATGHNLDDEAQGVLMNLIKANTDLLLRTEVKSLNSSGFTPRIKPFMFIPEKMILAYTVVKGWSLSPDECPYAHQSLRATVRDSLNTYESEHRGTKLALVEAGLRVSENRASPEINSCSVCGEPSAGNVCRACLLKKDLSGDAM